MNLFYKRFILTLLGGLIYCSSSLAIDEKVFSDFISDELGNRVDYSIVYPKGFIKDEVIGVLFYFHGNSPASKRNTIIKYGPFGGEPRTYYVGNEKKFGSINTLSAYAYNNGLILVGPVAKGTRKTNRGISLQWKDSDMPLIEQLLKSNFKGKINVDHNRVYFVGASQGTCFLNKFIPKYGEAYGGGFIAGCGCTGANLDYSWQPSEAFKDKFGVYVFSEKKDFLYESGLGMYDYYQYHAGLDTFPDLDDEGGHCDNFLKYTRKGIEWLINGHDISNIKKGARWETVAVLKDLQSVKEDKKGHWYGVVDNSAPVTMARRMLSKNKANFKPYKAIVRSEDKGKTWQVLWQSNEPMLSPRVRGFPNYQMQIEIDRNGYLWVNFPDGLKYSNNSGQSFKAIASAEGIHTSLYLHNDQVFVMGLADGVSTDLSTGKVFAQSGHTGPFVRNKIITKQGVANANFEGHLLNAKNVFFAKDLFALQIIDSKTTVLRRSQNNGKSWEQMTLPGAVANFVVYQDTYYAIYAENKSLKLITSKDEGKTWQNLSQLPMVPFKAELVAVTENELFLYSRFNQMAYYSIDSGVTWEKMPSLAKRYWVRYFTSEDGVTYAVHDGAIMRWYPKKL